MPSPFTDFHAHVYFTEDTQHHAKSLYERLTSEVPDVQRGTFHTRTVGPHPTWMFTVSFTAKDFQALTLWLMGNLDGLSTLVHPLSGNDLLDHTQYALWFGPQLELHLDKL